MALPWVRRALQALTSSVEPVFRQEVQPLEYGAIVESHCIGDELVIASFLAVELGRDTVGKMLNAASDFRVVEHADDRTANVRDRELGSSAPDSVCSKERTPLNVLQQKVCAMPLLVPSAYFSSSHDNNVEEDLLCQIPVFGGGPATNVSRAIKRRH